MQNEPNFKTTRIEHQESCIEKTQNEPNFTHNVEAKRRSAAGGPHPPTSPNGSRVTSHDLCKTNPISPRQPTGHERQATSPPLPKQQTPVIMIPDMEKDFRWLIMDKTGQTNLFVLKCILILITTLFISNAPVYCMASHNPSEKTTDPNDRPAEPNYTRHIAELKKKLPNKDFTVILQKPFVVIGDEPPETVRRRSIRTVKWSVDKLKQDYFKNDPNKIINIWLFKDYDSYHKHTRQLFNERPTTPFGYYSDKHNALIMNIATGGGTLVHEIVHPFMSANFPQCPPWFNEGLASLYEQSREKNGHIYGMTNWRLKGLQKDIHAGKVRPFKDLTSANDFAFYNKPSGDNYAQARYLCYYLQQKNLLTKYFHQFRANCKNDPTGYKTLKNILGTNDMKKFQKKWESFVLKLKFP